MTSKLINYVILKLIILFYLQTELIPPQEASVDIYKASQKAYKHALQHEEYQILADLWKNCMNSYPTVRKFLGHPNTCKLLNGWHPLMEKKNMMLLTAGWRKKQPSNTQASAKKGLSSQQQQFQREKEATSSEKGQSNGTSHETLKPGLQNPKDSAGCHGKCISDGQNNDGTTEKGGSQIKISEIISDIFDSIPELYKAIDDVKTHVSDNNSSICTNIKIKNTSLSQINETLMCFEKVLRTIKTSNNNNPFGKKINEQSDIIKGLTDKHSKFNIDDIIETRIKQVINIIKADYKKVLDEISNSLTEVKTYTIALKKCFDASKEEASKLTMKLNQVTADNTRQTELWQELTHKEDMNKIELINLIQAFQHELRNSQRCSNSKMNEIEQLLNTLPTMSKPLNQNEGTRISNPHVLDDENSQLKNQFSTSFHNLEPSMGQEHLKEVPKLNYWSHFSGEGEYYHMEFIRGIDMI
ncbi:hypothetical protein O181_115612 [Austropuccinia psidii MF-1]|uniref:Uncharacterized protein n=1 Tax=Austropuccinia psidii MF-1 TaxID=1389203 RepID=A0A9Q3K9V5_9BASI|nr:hypothetical protein [Austropuccinia psidii MF-1]